MKENCYLTSIFQNFAKYFIELKFYLLYIVLLICFKIVHENIDLSVAFFFELLF